MKARQTAPLMKRETAPDEQSTRRIHTAVVGVGAMTETIYLPALYGLPEFELDILVDPMADRSRLEEVSRQYRCQWTDSLEALDGRKVDLVIVATPISTHYEIAYSLVSRGISVLVEKPLTHSYAEAVKLLAKADECNARVFCGQMRRFYPNVSLIRELMQNRLIGELRSVSIFFGGLYGWNRRYFDDDITRQAAIDEGVLFDIGSHPIDVANFVLGDQADRYVVDRVTVDDVLLQNDMCIEGTIYLATGDKSSLFIALSNSTTLANTIWFAGSNGTLLLPSSENIPPVLYPAGNPKGIKLVGASQSDGTPFLRQLRTVADALVSGRTTIVDGKAVLPTVQILDDAFAKARKGSCAWL